VNLHRPIPAVLLLAAGSSCTLRITFTATLLTVPQVGDHCDQRQCHRRRTDGGAGWSGDERVEEVVVLRAGQTQVPGREFKLRNE